MKQHEQDLLQALNADSDAFENFFDADGADRPLISVSPSNKLAKSKGNPTFSAQFDLTIQTVYATQDVATGLVWATITPAALLIAASSLCTKLAFFLFGYSDYTSAYANAISQFPLSIWQQSGVRIVGRDVVLEDQFGSNWKVAIGSQLRQGDVVLCYYGGNPNAGASLYWAYVIIRSTQVAYGTLLNAMSSDRFVINLIRYIQNDTTPAGLLQYSNNIAMLQQTLYGKSNKDFVSPNSFKKPDTFQNGIIDIPLKKGLDKQECLASYLNYDAVNIQWSIFVWSTKKL